MGKIGIRNLYFYFVIKYEKTTELCKWNIFAKQNTTLNYFLWHYFVSDHRFMWWRLKYWWHYHMQFSHLSAGLSDVMHQTVYVWYPRKHIWSICRQSWHLPFMWHKCFPFNAFLQNGWKKSGIFNDNRNQKTGLANITTGSTVDQVGHLIQKLFGLEMENFPFKYLADETSAREAENNPASSETLLYFWMWSH